MVHPAALKFPKISNRLVSTNPIQFQQNQSDFIIRGNSNAHMYATQLQNSPNKVMSLQLNCVNEIDKNHWLPQLLQEYVNGIEKLQFNSCSFRSNDFLSQPMNNVTHLTFRSDFPRNDCDEDNLVTIDLPRCRKLCEFEYRGREFISAASLDQLIRENPNLKRLLLYNFCGEDITFDQLIVSIAQHLPQLHELALVDDWYAKWDILQQNAIDGIVNSFPHLQSLELSVDKNTVQLLRRLGEQCGSIKRLTLHQISDDEYMNENCIAAICSFKQIEQFDGHFDFMNGNADYFHFFTLFCECTALQQITHHIQRAGNERPLITTRFLNEFKWLTSSIGKSNAQIQVKKNGEILLTIIALEDQNGNLNFCQIKAGEI